MASVFSEARSKLVEQTIAAPTLPECEMDSTTISVTEQSMTCFAVDGLLSSNLCAALVKHFEDCKVAWARQPRQWIDVEGIHLFTGAIDPTLCHGSIGHIDVDMRLHAWCQELLSTRLSPLIAQLYRNRHSKMRHGIDTADFFAFIIAPSSEVGNITTPDHCDESSITFNITLATEETCPRLTRFAVPQSVVDDGLDVGDAKESSTTSAVVQQSPKVGSALIHLGGLLHSVESSGNRLQLIFYCLPRRPSKLQSTPLWYPTYRHYLAYKQWNRPVGANVMFAIPTLPGWVTEIARSLLLDCVRPRLPSSPFVSVADVVIEVASFMLPSHRMPLKLVSRAWYHLFSRYQDKLDKIDWEVKHRASVARHYFVLPSTFDGPVSITIGVGGIGCSIAGHVWDTLAIEAGLDADGFCATTDAPRHGVAFFETEHGRYRPRGLLIDRQDPFLDPATDYFDVESNCRAPTPLQRWRSMFDPQDVVRGGESSDQVLQTFSDGEVDAIGDALRRQLEACSMCDGVALLQGTGSGYSSGFPCRTVMEHIGLKGHLLSTVVLPSRVRDDQPESAFVNTLLSLSRSGADVSLVFTNDGLFAERCQSWPRHSTPAYNPYRDAEYAAQGLLGATALFGRNSTTRELGCLRDLCGTFPFTGLPYVTGSCQPFAEESSIVEASLSAVRRLGGMLRMDHAKDDAGHEAPPLGKLMTAAAVYCSRGVPNSALVLPLHELQRSRRLEFAHWMPSPGVKVFRSDRCLYCGPSSGSHSERHAVTLLASATVFGTVLDGIRCFVEDTAFPKMQSRYAARAICGDSLKEASEKMRSIIDAYSEAGSDPLDPDDEEEI